MKLRSARRRVEGSCLLMFFPARVHLVFRGVAFLALSLLLATAGDAQISSAASPSLAEAKRHLAADRLSAAEATLRQLLVADPANAQASFLLGEVLLREGRPQDSLAAFTAGARFSDPDTGQLILVASDYILLKDLADAEHWLTYTTVHDPTSIAAWYLLGRTRYNLERDADAVTAFQRTLALSPRYLKAEYNLGLAEQRLHHLSQAEADFRQALAWQADQPVQDPQPWLDLGLLFLKQGMTQQALEPLQQAARFGADNPFIQQQLGVCLETLGRNQDAVAALRKAVVLAPNASQPHYLLGRLARQLGNSEEATREFTEVTRLLGTHSNAETPNPDSAPVPPMQPAGPLPRK